MNYRSVVMFGVPRVVTNAEEKWSALKAIVDHVVEDRFVETRAPSDRELRATTVIALRISEASAKTRSAPPADLSGAPECWSGVIGCRLVFDKPTPDARTITSNVAPPDATRYERYVMATGR